MIEGFYKRPITQLNKDQALVPSKCVVLHNQMGTARHVDEERKYRFISVARSL